MRARGFFDGEPATGVFWWAAKLAGEGRGEGVANSERQLFAARRGIALETYVLSALFGLAALGCGFELLQRCLGVFGGLLLVLPATFVGLHLVAFAWAAVGELLIRFRILPRPWLGGFNGVALAGSIAVTGLLFGIWAAIPWVALVACEAFAWPARKFWEMTGEGAQ